MGPAAKTIGIIGGIGPESTIEYYRLILAGYLERKPDGAYPAIVINSIDMQRLLGLIAANDLAGVTEYLVREIARLSRAGVDFALMAANTPHIVFDEVHSRVGTPLISIVEATCEAAKAMGMKKPGLFGTSFTMQGRFYPDVFTREGIALAVPSRDEQTYIHDKYMGELVLGVIRPETREGLLGIVDQMREREGIDGLILGGTELPLILREPAHRGIPFLDTTRIHVARALRELGV
jgi:aspartate racemase